MALLIKVERAQNICDWKCTKTKRVENVISGIPIPYGIYKRKSV